MFSTLYEVLSRAAGGPSYLGACASGELEVKFPPIPHPPTRLPPATLPLARFAATYVIERWDQLCGAFISPHSRRTLRAQCDAILVVFANHLMATKQVYPPPPVPPSSPSMC